MKQVCLKLLPVLFIGALMGTCKEPESSRTSAESPGERIVSLAPSLTEILFELDVGDRVVGVTSYCDFPPEVQTKARVGDFINPNLEQIVSLQPDLIVAEHWPSSKTVPRLRRFGLNVLEVTSPTSIQDIYAVIRDVGAAVGREQRARQIQDDLRARMEAIETRRQNMPYHPSVYLEIDLPSWTIGRQSSITEALELCGLKNIFADVEKPALQASKEMIIARNPQIIVSFTVGKKEISVRAGWESIAAVQNGWIIDDFDEDLLSRPNHRLVQGMEELQRRVIRLLQSRDREGAGLLIRFPRHQRTSRMDSWPRSLTVAALFGLATDGCHER